MSILNPETTRAARAETNAARSRARVNAVAPTSPRPRPPARPLPTDRRIRPRAIAGGSRSTDPPLTTRECADWMGLTASWVRAAIDEGVTVGGRVVRLEAETLMLNGRRINRIHLDRFVVFLAAIGWKRIPRHPRRVA
jgi:hypothetical protein